MRGGGKSGQASLEYIITLCAALAFISVSMGFFGGLRDGTMFALDVQNAKGFAQRLGEESRTLLLLGDGSQSAIEAQIIGEWKTGSGPQGAQIIVSGTSGKTATVPLAHEIRKIPERAFSKKISATLEKSGGNVLWRD